MVDMRWTLEELFNKVAGNEYIAYSFGNRFHYARVYTIKSEKVIRSIYKKLKDYLEITSLDRYINLNYYTHNVPGNIKKYFIELKISSKYKNDNKTLYNIQFLLKLQLN
jgi:hypothetical protein